MENPTKAPPPESHNPLDPPLAAGQPDPGLDVFDRLRLEKDGPRAKGDAFERLMKKAFLSHPGEYGSSRFRNVWLWEERPKHYSPGYGADLGIDLVAEQTEDYGGGLCAIQCKFYAQSSQVPTSSVDSFLAASDSEEYKSRILVLTGGLTKQAQTKLENASPRCEILFRSDLLSWPVVWEKFLDNPDQLVFQDRSQYRYKPHSYQEEAVKRIVAGFETRDRGKLILPCGTGKSVVALWAAERIAGQGGRVLYLVPSIALMGQTMREWALQRDPRIPHRYIGICSDTKTGRISEDASLGELAMPVTTDPDRIAEQLAKKQDDAMTVVFSTYQSLQLVADAQTDPQVPAFDLAIGDEAHRTTGIQGSGRNKDSDSGFQIIHDQEAIKSRRRLYMTATPRLYTADAKTKVKEQDKYLDVYSMDDEQTYGPEFYRMGFGKAVDDNILADYKVLVIAVAEELAASSLEAVDTKEAKLKLQDVVKFLGCWDALADPTTARPTNHVTGKWNPNYAARRAIAFTNRIKTSQLVERFWGDVTDTVSDPSVTQLSCEVRHVDGQDNAWVRHRNLEWLRKERGGDDNGCRIVTNAKCLTEGVDVPALDAVLFMEPKSSQIDVVQAVGRVMRRPEGKEYGYVVLPVLVPENSDLSDSDFIESTDFKGVWDVLKALRSHDDRLNVEINTVQFGGPLPLEILTVGDICNQCGKRTRGDDHQCDAEKLNGADNGQLRFPWQDAIASKLVQECGDRQYWDRWAGNVAEIADRINTRIRGILKRDPAVREAFSQFLESVQEAVGEHITLAGLRAMLSHHIVTIPVFNALFAGNEFAQHNPVSQALDQVLKVFDNNGHHLQDETSDLKRFYDSVGEQLKAAGNSSDARLQIMLDIYEEFFKKAMKEEVKRLGIVYTPVELVDFMIRSAEAVLRHEFGYGLTDENVHILDPFSGTGTFINRLLTQKDVSGEYLIRDKDMHRKFVGSETSPPEIHANEVVMLAYYLAVVKIEEAFSERTGKYHPFSGMVLTDTLGTDSPNLLGDMANNNRRRQQQDHLPIQVILGNPPWSAGQKSAGDDNPNIEYPDWADRVKETYVNRHRQITGRAPGGNSSGNLYIQAIRWASDRLNGPDNDPSNPGVVAFIHPNSLTDGTSLAGARAVLRDEFTSIYVVNLRGDAYKTGEEWAKEGDKIFGGGSRNGVQITILVRNPANALPGVVKYVEVPDGTNLADKFAWLEELGDVTSDQLNEIPVTPRHDWRNLTDGTFDNLLQVCSTAKNNSEVAIQNHASGVKTNCDTYVYSFSRQGLTDRVKSLIAEYDQARLLIEAGMPMEESCVNDNLGTIKWTDTLKQSARRNQVIKFDQSRIREVLYRPFSKLWLYEDDRILSSVKTISSMFPRSEVSGDNTSPEYRGGGAVVVTSNSNRTIFGTVATDTLSDLCAAGTNQPCRAIPRRRS